MIAKLKRCPFCNSHELTLEVMNEIFNIRCFECGAMGPNADSETRAVDRWNEGEHGATCLVNGLAENRNDFQRVEL